jgi:hypothetical protein
MFINAKGASKAYVDEQTSSITQQSVIKHKILVAGIFPAFSLYFPLAEEAYGYGFLTEVCSLEAFVKNYKAWKNDFDVLVLASSRISWQSPITAAQLKAAVKYFMDNGVKIVWLHRQTSVVFEKNNNAAGIADSKACR